MNNCQQLHETIVRDVIDVMNDVKNYDQIEWLRKRNNVGSIAKRASNLILVFPVICSTAININTASIISKAIERKCVSLLQILFSSIQLTSVDNMYDYIKQFHTNLDLRDDFTLDDFMTVMDKMVDEGAVNVTDLDAYNAIKEDMHNINYTLSTELNPISINDYKIIKNAYGESGIICEAMDEKSKKYVRQALDDTFKKAAKSIIKTTEKNSTNKNKLKDDVDYFKYQLSTGDVQKANELMPTTMIVNFTTNDKDNNKFTTTGVIGVKAKLYPVDSMDIISRIVSKHKESNTLFNLVRASTREISFFKDLAFAIDKTKMDAINVAKDSNNTRIFKLLERRANRNRFSSLLRKNDASPITSLIISQEEVEYLKKYNSINMDKPHIARNILDKYNLMNVTIADESLEIARFLYDDGDTVFETLPFDSLEKEAKDSSYKKVINLMSRIK